MTEEPALDVRRLVGSARLVPLSAPARTAIGERRSRAVGSGIEFAEYRDYEPGDDIRHLDRNVYARSGRTVVRLRHKEQRLNVVVLLDGSASMAGAPDAWARAVDVASVFGQAAINGADQVRFGVFAEGKLEVGPVVLRQAGLLQEAARLRAFTPRGAVASLAEAVPLSAPLLTGPGLLAVVSDWWLEGIPEALEAWRVRGQEVVGVHLHRAQRAEELAGWVRLVDAETGEELERHVDAGTLRELEEATRVWLAGARDATWRAGGRWISVGLDGGVGRSFVHDLRRLGLIR